MGNLINVEFTAAKQLTGLYPWQRRRITSQPGYRRGKTMSIRKTKNGGIRLYLMVGVNWMDASLKDMTF